MKRKITTIIAFVIFCLAFIAVLSLSQKAEALLNPESQTIADLALQMNELRTQKEQCYDNLNYEQSRQSIEGKIKVCTERDDEIMALREQYDKLWAKSYERLGL